MKTLIFNYWGTDLPVDLIGGEYEQGGLYLQLNYDGEILGTLTVWLGEVPKEYAFLDVGNMPNAPEFVEKYDLGVYAGSAACYEECAYPLYKFNIKRVCELAAFDPIY